MTASVVAMAERVSAYVPGYRLVAEPQFDEIPAADGVRKRVAVFLEVEGNGDYLPPFAGNLDIMTAAAAQVGDMLASARRGAARR